MAVRKMDRLQMAQVLGTVFGHVSVDGNYIADAEHCSENACSAEVPRGPLSKE